MNGHCARAAAMVALLLSACATEPSATPNTTSTTSPTLTETGSPLATPTRTAPSVPEIWRFDASLVGGGTIDGADLAGDKVAVWLWAPW